MWQIKLRTNERTVSMAEYGCRFGLRAFGRFHSLLLTQKQHRAVLGKTFVEPRALLAGVQPPVM